MRDFPCFRRSCGVESRAFSTTAAFHVLPFSPRSRSNDAASVLPSDLPLPPCPAAPAAEPSPPPPFAAPTAAAALRLLVLDAVETRAALAASSTDSAADEEADSGTDVLAGATAADDADWSSLSFAEALLAWQEAPLAELSVF